MLGNHFEDSPCWVAASDTRIYVEKLEVFAYPDLVVMCEEPHHFNPITITNPTGIVEVLSPSTERYDRNVKLPAYLALPSVQAVALVATETKQVEVYTRGGMMGYTEGDFDFLGCRIS